MTQADSLKIRQVERRNWKRLLPVTGTVLVVFWPELIFIVALFQGERSIYAFLRDAESTGFMVIYLMVAHGLQVPLLCPLGVFWYGVTHRQTGFARVGYGMLIPVAVVVSYLFFAFVHARWFPWLFYAIGLLLLSPGLMRNSRQMVG